MLVMHLISLVLPLTICISLSSLSLSLSLSLSHAQQKDGMCVGNYQLFSFVFHSYKSILFYVIAQHSFNYQEWDFTEPLANCQLLSFVLNSGIE